MKVAIAAQTLSYSVAAGIKYLHSLKLEQFENSRIYPGNKQYVRHFKFQKQI